MINYQVPKKDRLTNDDNDEPNNFEFMPEFLDFGNTLSYMISNFSEACIGYISSLVVKKLLDVKKKQ